jgi:ElaB/YqjD/DUF883 family membrane-anchored ribosome-binding protein
MTTVNSNKPVQTGYSAPSDGAQAFQQAEQVTAAGAAADAKPLPEDLKTSGNNQAAAKNGSPPQLVAPNASLLSTVNLDDLMLLVREKKDQSKEVQQKNTLQTLSNAEEMRKTQSSARLEVMNTAVKNASPDLLNTVINYAVKNPQQLLAFAASVGVAVVAAVSTGGASIPASLVTLVGQAAPIVTGMMKEAGLDLKELLSKTAEAVLVWAGVPADEAYKYADISASVLLLGAEIGMSVLSKGQYKPNPALLGMVAEDVAKALNFSIGGAESLGATVTSLASISIALGFGIAAAGSEYGGIGTIWEAAEKVGASVINDFKEGKVDIAKILQEAGPLKDLFDELAKQINADSGGALLAVWGQMQESFGLIAQYIENSMTPPPQNNQRGYA